MKRVSLTVALALLFTSCADPRQVQMTLENTERTLEKANEVHARLCAPEEMAEAESSVAFTLLEFKQGSLNRARYHVDYAQRYAQLALEKATPCGTADRDKDKIADIVDRCPDEPEDYDGVQDEDGCRDIDPYGDEDGDGIINVDDACIDDPEDFDGHNDEDGCPETSEDSDGDGIIDVRDQCPDDAEDLDGFMDSDGCPDLDNDNDGVADLRDACPKIPEDLDSWEDEDGCPDPDNDLDGIPDSGDECPNEPGVRENNGCPDEDKDKDGIADANDKCPEEPETYNEYLDEDGCPDTPPTRVKVTRTRINFEETIKFASGSARLLADNPVLEDVLKVLKDADWLRVRIEGHTDSEGSDSFNMQLSKDRAQAVRDFLTQRGIAADRLETAGYGETRPLDTNRTASGRARNRRVEFHIVE